MKTIILKQALSVATLAVALGGALVTNASAKAEESAVLVQGWTKGNPEGTICHQSLMCETTNTGNLCQVDYSNPSSAQIFSRLTQNSPCTREVYKPRQ